MRGSISSQAMMFSYLSPEESIFAGVVRSGRIRRWTLHRARGRGARNRAGSV